MDSMNRHQLPERNPKTHAKHREEVFWQVILPLLVGVLLVLAALAVIVISALQPATELSRWADVSLMWLILPALFFALLLLVVVAGLGYAVTALIRLIPRYARLVQLYFEAGENKASQLTNLFTAPIIRIQTAMAVVQRILGWKPGSMDEH